MKGVFKVPRINVLPKNIADLIAAGEVVERPSSVIKEFVENSIDAGARKIIVEIKNGGKTYMRVTDDGCGIHKDDVKKAFISHATSKISSADDLDRIATLGFRGEALASVCAVSKVEVMTATAQTSSGTHYVIEGGEEKLIDEIGSPLGTTIIVRDLFFNIPARLKFLKKDVQEGNYIAAILEKIAISNPNISFKFLRDGKIAFQTPGDGDLKSAVYAVFGRDFTSQLLPVNSEHNGITVNGFVTKPTAGRGSRSMQIFFVNGRYVKSLLFMSALEAAYKNSIMVGKYPGCVLFVNMPFEAVDVNVHPAKTEVRFFDEKRIFEAVYNGTLSAITEDKSRVQATFQTAKAFMDAPQKGEQLKIEEVKVYSTVDKMTVTPEKVSLADTKPLVIKEYGTPVTGKEDIVKSPEKEEKQLDFLKDEYYIPKVTVINTDNVPEKDVKADAAVSRKQVNVINKNENKEESKVVVEASEDNEKDVSINIHTESKLPPKYNYIGEAFNTYLIAELEGKLVLIDKHAAHERILFEKFKNEGVGESQMMLLPVTVTLSADEYSAVLDNTELLENAGYEITDFGDRTVKLSACPVQLVSENLKDVVTEIAGYLSRNIKTLMPEKLDWIYHSMACRAAVKAGNFTSRYEAEKFVGVVLSDDSIRYCPHGRPVLIELTQKELEKQFKRIM